MATPETRGVSRTTCPDCETCLQNIKLLSPVFQGGELEYAADDAQSGRFTGRFPIAGKVRASMCPTCGRVVLHAEPSAGNAA
jgi:hypothetical protein